MNAAYTSGVILYLNVETNKETLNTADLNKEISNCYKCFDCLGKYERRFQSAGYFRDILAEIFSDLPNHRQPENETRTTLRANNRSRFGSDTNFEHMPSGTTAQRDYPTSIRTQSSLGSSAFGPVSTAPSAMSLPIYIDLQANPPAQDTPGYPNLDAYNSNLDWMALNASNSDQQTANSSGMMETQGSAYMHRFIDDYLLGPLGISDTWNPDPGWDGGNASSSDGNRLPRTDFSLLQSSS
ncbi:hypothetical protein MPER_11023 [Moniliophthora perniciosa FA553]|nr:hypothetical protein MPER_11023 [Moniliophthora perniciosa FA553]